MAAAWHKQIHRLGVPSCGRTWCSCRQRQPRLPASVWSNLPGSPVDNLETGVQSQGPQFTAAVLVVCYICSHSGPGADWWRVAANRRQRLLRPPVNNILTVIPICAHLWLARLLCVPSVCMVMFVSWFFSVVSVVFRYILLLSFEIRSRSVLHVTAATWAIAPRKPTAFKRGGAADNAVNIPHCQLHI